MEPAVNAIRSRASWERELWCRQNQLQRKLEADFHIDYITWFFCSKDLLFFVGSSYTRSPVNLLTQYLCGIHLIFNKDFANICQIKYLEWTKISSKTHIYQYLYHAQFSIWHMSQCKIRFPYQSHCVLTHILNHLDMRIHQVQSKIYHTCNFLSQSRLSDPFFGVLMVISEFGSRIYIC